MLIKIRIFLFLAAIFMMGFILSDLLRTPKIETRYGKECVEELIDIIYSKDAPFTIIRNQ